MKYHPILKNFKNFLIYKGFWVALSSVGFLILYFAVGENFYFALIDSFLFNLLLALIGIFLWFPVRYISIEKDSIKNIIINHSILSLLSTGIWIFIGYQFISMVSGFHEIYNSFFINTLAWRFTTGLLFYFSIVSVYYTIIYYENYQYRLNSESELRNLINEAELRNLKFQINPHFIFNSLNSISALTTLSPEKAKDMIIKLSGFLRYTLANNEKKTNSLKEEIENIRLYLEIEKIRFEDKFNFTEKVEKGLEEVKLPSMLLQPLAENAIKHGVYDALDKTEITLECSLIENFLKIVFKNSFEENNIKPKGAGVGLENIKNRLKLFYGKDNLFDIKKTKDNFIITIYIPV
jgi:two-component system, LytTR family, sensor kinase